MKRMRVVLATLLILFVRLFVLTESVHAAVIPVSPGQSINAAMEQAGEGDTVLLLPGTYQEPVRLKGGVVLRGQAGAAGTRLLGLSGEAVISASGPGQRTVDGITIDGQYAARAGVEADLYDDGALAVTNCVIVQSAGPGVEAVLWGHFARLALADNLVAGNTGRGVAISADMSWALMRGNTVAENAAGGGAVFATDGAVVELIGNRLEANFAGAGGGLAVMTAWGGQVAIAGNRIAGNTALYGGGIDAVANGGGIQIVNNDIHWNQADEHGGLSADARLDGYLDCTQNTVVRNESRDLGVWIGVEPDSAVRVANNIFWGNSALDYAGPDARHSLIGTGRTAGTQNLSAAPLFADAEAGDYRLSPGSPGIDQGDNDAVPLDIATDADGKPRVREQIVDIGAYEFVSARHRIADLKGELEEMVEGGLVEAGTGTDLQQRLLLADFYLYRRGRNGARWSRYHLDRFISLVQEQSGATIQPQAAAKLEAEARAIAAQLERWGS